MNRWVSAADTRFEFSSKARALAQHHDPNIADPRFPKCDVLQNRLAKGRGEAQREEGREGGREGGRGKGEKGKGKRGKEKKRKREKGKTGKRLKTV